MPTRAKPNCVKRLSATAMNCFNRLDCKPASPSIRPVARSVAACSTSSITRLTTAGGWNTAWRKSPSFLGLNRQTRWWSWAALTRWALPATTTAWAMSAKHPANPSCLIPANRFAGVIVFLPPPSAGWVRAAGQFALACTPTKMTCPRGSPTPTSTSGAATECGCSRRATPLF